ncbi:hypothetical protein P4114_21340 [Pseudomonas aeruginosa]|nr:hypothetical protein [Pseudomonas aeruginosa]
MRNAGIDVHAGYDIEAQCRHAYETNNEAVFIAQDVKASPRNSLKPGIHESKVATAC